MTEPRDELPALADSVALRSSALSAEVHSLGVTVREDLDALSDATEALFARVDLASKDHSASCRDTRARIARARTALASALTDLQSRTSTLAQSAHDHRERLDHAASANADAQTRLREQITSGAHQIEDDARSSTQHATAMVSDVGQWLQQLRAVGGQLVEQLSHLDHSAHDQVQALADTLDELVTHVRSGIEAASDVLERDRNGLRDALQSELGDVFLGRLDSAAERLRGSLDALDQRTAGHVTDVGDRSSGVVGAVRDALQLFEALRPALETIRFVLG
jgi:chromosome segregation ATPase